MTSLTIGAVAKHAEVNIETMRYYERRGLILRPPRSCSNYRLYPPDTVQRVRFIKRAQHLGFTLKEIKELLALRVDRHAKSADVRNRVRAKIEDIEDKIRGHHNSESTGRNPVPTATLSSTAKSAATAAWTTR